jgi:drug/metabolite transporter (DMT)-like permease
MNTNQDNITFISVFALLTVMFLWASSFAGMKIAVTGMHPLHAMALRMFTASVVLLPLAGRMRGQIKKARLGDWLMLGLVALFEPCLYFLFESYALRLTYASQASMISAMLPVMILLGARWQLKERVSARTAFGFGLAMAGAMWLSATGSADSDYAPNPVLGNFLEFLGMSAAAVATILIKRLTERFSPHFLTAMQSVGGLIFFAPLSLATAGLPQAEIFTTASFWAVIYLGVFVSIGAYGLWNYSLSKLPASRASAAINLIPVFSVTMAFLILGERFTGQQFVAAGVVLAGILITRKPRRPRFPR